ncbi:hypothetical protein Pint_26622 [Pistacia integerrima]|uniref:Uncharacterized protein n=1 Tax=Pistacia integerrima TaxID=434235 RepID=A0ACC0YTD4_9ROSI|nr:hypothetical protein Pint_26622 [Pistacia integerrima]
MAETTTKPPHIALLPTLGLGYLVPFMELAKRLAHFHNLHVTCIVPTNTIIGFPPNSIKADLEALNSPSLNHILLPPANLDDLPQDTELTTLLYFAMSRSMPSLRKVLKYLMENNHLVAFIIYPPSNFAFEIARGFNLLTYIFFPSSGICLSWWLYLHKLDEMVPFHFRDLLYPVRVPGSSIRLRGRDFPDLDKPGRVWSVEI